MSGAAMLTAPHGRAPRCATSTICSPTPVPIDEAIRQFRDALLKRGIVPPGEIVADGRIHRCDTEGPNGKGDASYVLHFDGIPAGGFQNWRDGVGWQNWLVDIGRPLAADEEDQHRARARAIHEQRAAEAEQRRAEAERRATLILEQSAPASPDHPYLLSKAVQSHGLRLHDGALVVPMRDASGRLRSVQFIYPDGKKRFLPGGRKSGCYFLIGDPRGVLCIVEGYATGASISEATGYSVAVAFDAGNLEPVVRALRAKFPDLQLTLCADDDAHAKGNPGLTKATAAARSVGGLLAVPNFGDNRPEGASDFNDLARIRGAEAVRKAIGGAREPDEASLQASGGGAPTHVSESPDTATHQAAERSPEMAVADVADVQINNGAAFGETEGATAGVADVTESDPLSIPERERPCFKVFDVWTTAHESSGRLRPGVWYFGVKGGEPPSLTQRFVCSPVYVEAVTFDQHGNNFGRLLRFRNTLGHWREWAMPMELLRASGDDLRGELLAMGVEIDPNAHRLLGQYLQSLTPTRRVRCALQVGWCDRSFVLPDEVIGPETSDVIFQSGERGHDEYTRAGSLAGWQSDIAALAVGNPVLTLALCAAFAGPMLARCNVEGGGVHFVGDSSTGKTTLIEAACSVWGGSNFRRSWRATANGMEGAAALFNDGMLALDEISECDPREVGAIVYALGNGRGKQRASRSGNARGVTRWRVFVLSSGERTIATAMQEGGHRAKAGQAVRLLDIPAARQFGAFDELHGLSSGAALADAVKRAAVAQHGHAGRAFLERLTRDERDFCARLERLKSLPEFSADGGEGQDKRAAGRFALLALAGEVVTEYGITGWPEGEAIKAAAAGFRLWQSLRGRGNDERREIAERVSSFIERHGDGRFSDAGSGEDTFVRDRAGWWRDEAGSRIYLFNADALREALRGFDFKRALDTLEELGALPPAGANGERAKALRIGGRPVKLYPIHPDKLEGAAHGA